MLGEAMSISKQPVTGSATNAGHRVTFPFLQVYGTQLWLQRVDLGICALAGLHSNDVVDSTLNPRTSKKQNFVVARTPKC